MNRNRHDAAAAAAGDDDDDIHVRTVRGLTLGRRHAASENITIDGPAV